MAPHVLGPWLRKGRGMHYATIDGQQVKLAKDYAEAVAALAAVLEKMKGEGATLPPRGGTAGTGPPSPSGPTVADAAASYLTWCAGRAAAGKIDPRTAKNYREQLAHLCLELGGRAVRSVTADELERWADKPGWSASYQNNVLGTVGMCFRRAGHALRIARPPKESRGADTCLTDDQFARVLEVVRLTPRNKGGDLPELLELLRETGSRPDEGARLEVEGVDWPNACTRLKQHKTKRKTGRDRVIHFNAAAMAVLERQRAAYPTGFLFRNGWGTRFRVNGICERLAAVSLVVGFRCIAYGLGRHTFATSALANGAPDALVAELLGHKGTGMLHRHYQHLGQRATELKAAAERATGKRAG